MEEEMKSRFKSIAQTRMDNVMSKSSTMSTQLTKAVEELFGDSCLLCGDMKGINYTCIKCREMFRNLNREMKIALLMMVSEDGYEVDKESNSTRQDIRRWLDDPKNRRKLVIEEV